MNRVAISMDMQVLIYEIKSFVYIPRCGMTFT